MKMILLLSFIFLTQYNIVYGEIKKGKKNNQKKLFSIIEKEIKTIKSFGKETARLKHRILELESEKVSLIKESENNYFIKNQHKNKKKKPFYFKKSTQYNKSLHKRGLKIISSFPHYRGINEIYLTLALNDQDYGTGNYIEKYLLKSLKFTRNNTEQKYRTNVHLAEYYYNHKKYKKAVKVYDKILANDSDEWVSKHYYNAAWCNLKVKRFERSLDMLEKAYKLGTKNKILSIKNQIIGSFHIFYITTDNLKRGISFLKENLKDITSPLLKFLTFATGQGRKKDSIYLIRLLKKEIGNKKSSRLLTEFYYETFKTFRHFSDYKNSYKAAVKFYKLDKKKEIEIPKDIKLEFIDEIKGLVGFLQAALIKNVKKDHANYKRQELYRIISFFSILAGLDKENKKTYYFFQGETYYSVHLYKKSIAAYKKSILNTRPLLPSKETEKTILNYIGTIDLASLNEKKRLTHIEFIYSTYLKVYPNTEKSKSIYKNLFAIYLRSDRFKKSEKLLDQYIKYHEREREHIKKYVLSLLNYYIKKKDSLRISSWIFKLRNSKTIRFKQSYLIKTEEILAEILFSNYEKMESEGKLKAASSGYEKLSKSTYPRKIRANSSLKNAQLLAKMGKLEDSYKSLKEAITTFNQKENTKNLESFLFLSKRYMLNHHFEISLAASIFLLEMFHKLPQSDNDQLFETIINLSLATGKKIKVRNYFKRRREFKISKKMEKFMAHLIIDHHMMFKSYKGIFNFYFENKNLTYLKNKFFHSFKIMFWQRYKKRKVLKIIQELGKDINSARSFSETIKSFRALEKEKKTYLAQSIKMYRPSSSKDKNIAVKIFDEKYFNKQLEDKINTLKELNKRYIEISKKGFPEISLRAYLSLNNLYHFLGNNIKAKAPTDRPKEFLIPFKKMMNGLGEKLLSESNEYKKSSVDLVNKYNLLTSINGMITINERTREWKINLPIGKLISPTALTRDIIKITQYNQPKKKRTVK